MVKGKLSPRKLRNGWSECSQCRAHVDASNRDQFAFLLVTSLLICWITLRLAADLLSRQNKTPELWKVSRTLGRSTSLHRRARDTCAGRPAGTEALTADMGSGSVSVGLRAMFSMLTPNESSFERVEEVPPYVQQVRASFHLHLLVRSVRYGKPFVPKTKIWKIKFPANYYITFI